MSKRFFVDSDPTEDGKYRVLQQDSETQESFGIEDFDTEEEAQNAAAGLQGAIDNAVSENPTGSLPEIGEVSNTADESEFKDTPQDLKDETSQE